MKLRFVAGIIEPLAVLPSQVAGGSLNRSPEIRLILAVVEDAIQCVLRNVDEHQGPRRQEFLDAQAWLLDDSRDWPFAFANLCDLLGLDAVATRQHLPIGNSPVFLESQQPTETNVNNGRSPIHRGQAAHPAEFGAIFHAACCKGTALLIGAARAQGQK